MNNIRKVIAERLEMIERELIETGQKLQSKTVFFNQDILSMKSIEKALTEVVKAQKHIKEK